MCWRCSSSGSGTGPRGKGRADRSGHAPQSPTLQAGLTSFSFQFLLQAGLFFVVPLFLSVALGLSAVATGVRLLPLSVALLASAVGVPKLFPRASPRRVVRIGFALLLLGIVLLLVLLDQGAGAGIVTGPLLLAGLGIGTLASQLGSVTVSAVPDSQSSEVGGVQNTVTNLGASLGTALAGTVLIGVLTTTFLGAVAANPAVPHELSSRAQVELSAGIPFVSDAQLGPALAQAGVPEPAAQAIVDANASSRHQRAPGRAGRPGADRPGGIAADGALAHRPTGDAGLRRGGRHSPSRLERVGSWRSAPAETHAAPRPLAARRARHMAVETSSGQPETDRKLEDQQVQYSDIGRLLAALAFDDERPRSSSGLPDMATRLSGSGRAPE